jgi:hypothetical protein
LLLLLLIGLSKDGLFGSSTTGRIALVLDFASSHLTPLLLDYVVLLSVLLKTRLDVVNGVVFHFFLVSQESLSLAVLISTDGLASFIEEQFVFAFKVAVLLDLLQLVLGD